MTVYVDDSRIPAAVPNGRVQHTSRWSHLFADSQDELHAFAGGLGLRRSWFQPGKPRRGRPSPAWHYDVTDPKWQRALSLGAQPVSWRDSAGIMRARDARAAELSAEARRLDPGSAQSQAPPGIAAGATARLIRAREAGAEAGQ